tara:strand:- start:1017 stop:1280 length:264 start_codon:yes stop_codon:yes gene_type:complete
MLIILFIIVFIFPLFSQENCPVENSTNHRSIYSVGETLSEEDQNVEFSVCNGSGDYSTGDSFSFSDLNGDLNGGDYKITIISMNATW